MSWCAGTNSPGAFLIRATGRLGKREAQDCLIPGFSQETGSLYLVVENTRFENLRIHMDD